MVAEVEKGDDLESVARNAGAEVVVDFTVPAAARSNALAIWPRGPTA